MLFSQESERLALLDLPEWMLRPRRERDKGAEARAKRRARSAHARRRERANGPAVAHRAQCVDFFVFSRDARLLYV